MNHSDVTKVKLVGVWNFIGWVIAITWIMYSGIILVLIYLLATTGISRL